MEELIRSLTKNMTDFQVWKADKISDLKVWWFCHVTLKLKSSVK